MAEDGPRPDAGQPRPPLTRASSVAFSTTSTAAPPDPPASFVGRLKHADEHWAWKLGIRVCICVVDVVGIGCVAGVVSNRLHLTTNPYLGYLVDKETSPFALAVVCPFSLSFINCEYRSSANYIQIQLAISFVWSLVAILVRLLRQPPRPVHPGVIVGVDLVLWLTLIITALVTIAATISLNEFGLNPDYLLDPSYGGGYKGNYYLAPNNTWVYNITYVWDEYRASDRLRYNSTSNQWYLLPLNTSDVTRDCSPPFATCKEQDAFINALWQSKPQRFALDVTAVVAQIVVLLLHFALFVWACVDTYRWNTSKRGDEVHVLAQSMIQNMHQRGLITIHGNVARTQQPMQQWHPAPAPAPALAAPRPVVISGRWA
jgi:hypothetical protein